VERFWNKNREKLWLPIEIFLMLTALLSPLFFSPQSEIRKKLLHNSLFHLEFLQEISSVNRNIASTYLELPSPQSLDEKSELKWSIFDRQIRFQFLHNDWYLENVKKKISEQDWEKVPLIYDVHNKASFSSYVELDEGENIFQLSYRSKKGKRLEYPVLITYTKKHKT
jgi:hypothetical protein